MSIDADLPIAALQLLIIHVAQAIVDDSNAVQVEATANGETIILRLMVTPQDTRTVIGKNGRMARSLRCLIVALSTKMRRKVILVIEEPQSR
jgi:predicted RNA-binding protein YlqC (UPF0109 family)